MTTEDIETIFNDENLDTTWKGDNAFQGLQIIAKYINPLEKNIIVGAEHDVLYSVDVQELIDAGITKDELVSLAKLNWSYDDENESFQCFV